MELRLRHINVAAKGAKGEPLSYLGDPSLRVPGSGRTALNGDYVGTTAGFALVPVYGCRPDFLLFAHRWSVPKPKCSLRVVEVEVLLAAP
jgi:hypothetical protein